VFRHIAVGCDGSPQRRDAVVLGAAIAGATHATLSLVCVVSPSLVPIPDVSDRKTRRAQAMRVLRRERGELAPDARVQAIVDSSVALVQRDFNHARIWESAREKALAEAKTASSRLDVAADVFASLGDPGYELRALSETVDLFLVGSRRWGPIARLVTGGVGETLVADASCSIIIVPRPPRQRPTTARGRERSAPGA
jgi:nucleotide-binding universal stress UspA family protein